MSMIVVCEQPGQGVHPGGCTGNCCPRCLLGAVVAVFDEFALVVGGNRAVDPGASPDSGGIMVSARGGHGFVVPSRRARRTGRSG